MQGSFVTFSIRQLNLAADALLLRWRPSSIACSLSEHDSFSYGTLKLERNINTVTFFVAHVEELKTCERKRLVVPTSESAPRTVLNHWCLVLKVHAKRKSRKEQVLEPPGVLVN